jgi:hypothetical protein
MLTRLVLLSLVAYPVASALMTNTTNMSTVKPSVKTARAGIAAAPPPIEPERIAAIAEMLPEAPAASGRPISDRAFWDRLAADPRYAGVVPAAEKLLSSPLPPWPADSYLDFSRDGNRTRYQNAENARRTRLPLLALAECLENKGRFIAPLAALIDSLCEEKTWVLPAHDRNLDNYNGKTIDIDLVSSAIAAQLGTIDYLLGDKLPAPTRQRLRDNVQKRVLDPFRDMVNGKRPANGWITTTNNWNAVCLNGVVGAALALEPSKQERARIVASAERYSLAFLSGFTADGYCGEGLGYWNYGFGNYYVLTEAVRQATNGKLDLLARPEARMPALFAARIQIINDIAPAFADCPIFARPSAPLMVALNRRFSLGLAPYARMETAPTANIYEAMVYAMGENAPALPTSAAVTPARSNLSSPLRDYFDAAGILIARPDPTGTAKMGVALKGGHNAEHHNHNDLGSFVVVVGDRPVLLDPGAETYTARTFSGRRYESKLLNSFGHPVPRFGDVLQRTGAEAKAKVLKADFTPETDTFSLDIASAYTLPALKSLTRTWVYSRKGDGSLTMTDRASFSAPTPYSTALLTLGGWQKNPDGTLFIYDGESAVTVRIDTGGKPYTVTEEVIREDAPVAPIRLGIALTEPATDATVTLTITPAVETFSAGADGNLLINGGFERGGYGWSLSRMGTVETERAATGTRSLRVRDDTATLGSDIASVRAPIPTGVSRLSLKGKVNFVSGRGIGLYVRYFDAAGKPLSVKDANGNETAVGVLNGDGGAEMWKPFAFSAAVPSGAVKAQVWIHSINAAQCDAYLDDLSLTPEK